MRPAPSIVVLASALILSVACGAPRAGVPASPGTTSNRFGAPSIPRQLDADVVAAAPCRTLLSASEIAELNAVQANEKEFLGAKGCTWTVRGTEKLSIVVYANRDYLVDTYRARSDPIFVPTEVEGFPSVRQKTGRGQLNICTVTTGLSDRAALDTVWVATGDPRPGNDACEFAEQATALVIRKLPPQR
jgi:hypothetical protein